MSHQIMTKDTMFSVREMPWHGLGTVLPDYPQSIQEALQFSGLGWQVKQGQVLVADSDGSDPMQALAIADKIAAAYSADGVGSIAAADLEAYLAARGSAPALQLADGYRANRRADDGAVLGIVSDDYKVVQNVDAFRFLDALIGSDLYYETAGSLMNGKRVWVLARLPEWVEVAGDQHAMFVYVANSHDGSMAVTSSVTGIRIVCANTLNWALRKSEAHAERTYKFRHTGDLAIKFDEARRVMGMTLNYAKMFKKVGDQLALEPFSSHQFEAVTEKLIPIDEDELGSRAIKHRERVRDTLQAIFEGKGPEGDTRGNSPGTKWCAVNAFAEYADWCRRYTKHTDQVQRSFEDGTLKQAALELVTAA